jgi:uncharacterized protein (UPF0305 family)
VRVRISYGANIEEVPEEIDQMFTYVSEKTRMIMRQVETIEKFMDEEDLKSALTIIDRLRKTLTNVDLRLADVEMISQGFLTHIEGEQNVPAGRPAMDSTGISDNVTDT